MKLIQWHKISESRLELFSGGTHLAEVLAGEKAVCVAMVGEQLKACAAKCPHAGARMADGYIDVLGNIVCPLHRYKFSLSGGRNVSGEGYFLKTFAVEEREDGIYVGIEEKNGFWGV
ncbi:MAG: Rieske 2Fe-2S domain-containing protein [Ferruginibacter sp.]|nr:Rieske 2Fe-2S domain-containing protein [Ferruginibacter sp.]